MSESLLDCKELAAALGKHHTFLIAMKRAGYVMEEADSGKSSLAHVLLWFQDANNWSHAPWFKPKRNAYSEFDPEQKKKHRKVIPASMRRFIFKRDGEKCHYCGTEEDLTIDHKLALARGGTSDPDNLLAACFSCNLAKRDMQYDEFKKVAHLRKRAAGGRPWDRVNAEPATPEQDARTLVRVFGLDYENILAAVKEGRKSRI